MKQLVVATALLLVVVVSCKKNTPEDPIDPSGMLTFSIQHTIGTDRLVFNQFLYTNEAGNEYQISGLKYFLSDITLYHDQGSALVLDDWQNIFYVDEFIKYNAEKFKLPLRFNLVHYPETMSIKNLPDKIKSIVLSKINNLSKEELSYIEKGFHIDNILNFMLESSTNNFEKFLETTNKHDAYRNQLFKKTFLEYWNALNENN